MGAHPIVTRPLNEKSSFSLVREEPQVIRAWPSAPSRIPIRPILAPRGKSWFSEAMLEASPTRPPRRTGDVLVSIALHVAILATVLFLPLYYTQTIDLKQFTRTLLIAPPPPPPPPPAPAAVLAQVRPATQRRLFAGGKLLAPVAIPKQVVILKEEPLRADADFAGVPGGVPGGIPGGQLGGVIGGILGGIPTSAARGPAPPAEKVRAPIRVGGRLRAPRAIYRLAPDYPPLARQARIQGDVTIDAVIDKAGSVVEMKVVSGPPLLIPAALAAARAWKFEPTYLNDEAIDVQFILTVHFQLQD